MTRPVSSNPNEGALYVILRTSMSGSVLARRGSGVACAGNWARERGVDGRSGELLALVLLQQMQHAALIAVAVDAPVESTLSSSARDALRVKTLTDSRNR